MLQTMIWGLARDEPPLAGKFARLRAWLAVNEVSRLGNDATSTSTIPACVRECVAP